MFFTDGRLPSAGEQSRPPRRSSVRRGAYVGGIPVRVLPEWLRPSATARTAALEAGSACSLHEESKEEAAAHVVALYSKCGRQ